MVFHLASAAFSLIRRLSALRTTSSATSFTWPLRLLSSGWFTEPTTHILTVPSSEPEVYDSPPGAYLTQCTGP
ncbi:unnamed protein product [Arabidopsis thaliana]|uniref:(thale cress) hypothetical protein n=1 Tax=Arabidopsis thaliana TaxID=3702 RepID=A0A7G2DX22_ARATH|nr:unnamed protein product [Arabidopsis thaliana]